MSHVQTWSGVLVGALLVGACQQAGQTSAADKADAAVPAAADIRAADLLLISSTPELDFAWRAPADVAGEPLLFRKLRAQAEQSMQDMLKTARDDRAARGADAAPVSYYQVEEWRVSASTPRLLSLWAELATYTGGAHGNYGFPALLWDKQADREIRIADLFTDSAAMFSALTPDYCRQLDEERKARRGGSIGEGFSDCPALDKASMRLRSGPDGKLWGAQVMLAPYEAGPYAEGAYEVTLSFPDSVKALVKPDYAADFAR